MKRIYLLPITLTLCILMLLPLSAKSPAITELVVFRGDLSVQEMNQAVKDTGYVLLGRDLAGEGEEALFLAMKADAAGERKPVTGLLWIWEDEVPMTDTDVLLREGKAYRPAAGRRVEKTAEGTYVLTEEGPARMRSGDRIGYLYVTAQTEDAPLIGLSLTGKPTEQEPCLRDTAGEPVPLGRDAQYLIPHTADEAKKPSSVWAVIGGALAIFLVMLAMYLFAYLKNLSAQKAASDERK